MKEVHISITFGELFGGDEDREVVEQTAEGVAQTRGVSLRVRSQNPDAVYRVVDPGRSWGPGYVRTISSASTNAPVFLFEVIAAANEGGIDWAATGRLIGDHAAGLLGGLLGQAGGAKDEEHGTVEGGGVGGGGVLAEALIDGQESELDAMGFAELVRATNEATDPEHPGTWKDLREAVLLECARGLVARPLADRDHETHADDVNSLADAIVDEHKRRRIAEYKAFDAAHGGEESHKVATDADAPTGAADEKAVA